MELALGFQFEDSVFARSRERGRGGDCAAYAAKRCEPQWFCEETNSEDDVEILTLKKFRGDLAYRQRKFQKALCEYSSCLLLLPSSNVAMRRDVQEGQARCLAHLGRHKEALDIAEKLDCLEKKLTFNVTKGTAGERTFGQYFLQKQSATILYLVAIAKWKRDHSISQKNVKHRTK